MDLRRYISDLEAILAEAGGGYYAQYHAGMPDADYVGYAYKRRDQTLGGKGFPYDRDRDSDAWQLGRGRGNRDVQPTRRPMTAKSKGATRKSGFEEAAGTPVNQTIGSRGGQQLGNPSGGMGGGWANRPTKPWDEEDEDFVDTLSRYGEAAGLPGVPVPVEHPAVLDPEHWEDQDDKPLQNVISKTDDVEPEVEDFLSFPSVLMQVAGSGFGTGLGWTNPSGRGFMDGWTEDLEILAQEGAWETLARILSSLSS